MLVLLTISGVSQSLTEHFGLRRSHLSELRSDDLDSLCKCCHLSRSDARNSLFGGNSRVATDAIRGSEELFDSARRSGGYRKHEWSKRRASVTPDGLKSEHLKRRCRN
jgi:hypothetical protein